MSESSKLVSYLEKMIVDGERKLDDPAKYRLDKDYKLREGVMLMVNQLSHKKEALEELRLHSH